MQASFITYVAPANADSVHANEPGGAITAIVVILAGFYEYWLQKGWKVRIELPSRPQLEQIRQASCALRKFGLRVSPVGETHFFILSE